jgi:hypothetical protein
MNDYAFGRRHQCKQYRHFNGLIVTIIGELTRYFNVVHRDIHIEKPSDNFTDFFFLDDK